VAGADLLIINKTDLAPYVGADVDRMISDATIRREGPVIATAVTAPGGVDEIASWVRQAVAEWHVAAPA
jgi:urease accessory protein